MDRSQRSIHHAMMQKLQQYTNRDRPPTAQPATFRRPDGMELTQRAYAKDAREHVAQSSQTQAPSQAARQHHQEYNKQQATSLARTSPSQTSVQRRENSLQSVKEKGAQRDNSFAKYTQRQQAQSQTREKQRER